MKYRWTVEYRNKLRGWEYKIEAKGEFCGGPGREDWTWIASDHGFRTWGGCKRAAKRRIRKDQMRRHFCRDW